MFSTDAGLLFPSGELGLEPVAQCLSSITNYTPSICFSTQSLSTCPGRPGMCDPPVSANADAGITVLNQLISDLKLIIFLLFGALQQSTTNSPLLPSNSFCQVNVGGDSFKSYTQKYKNAKVL